MGFNDLRIWSNNYMKLDIQKFAASLTISHSVVSQSVANNTSTVRITCVIKRTSGSTNWTHPYERTLTITCDGQTYSVSTELPSNKTSVTYTHDFDVPHNADGTKSISYAGNIPQTGSQPALSASGSGTLATIPRYTTVSTWSVSSFTETSVTLNWKTADTCSSIRYGTSTSSYTTTSVNTNSGSVTISGLSANTNYTLYFMPRRKDSGLWGNGSANTWKSVTQKTAVYPTVSAAPNFVIGSPVTISVTNPKSRNTSVAIKVGNTTIRTLTTSTTSVVYDSSLDSGTLYQLIPNNPSGTYTATATFSGVTTASKSGTFSVDTTNDIPDFNLFTWQDTNATTLALTGDNSKVVLGYSNIEATISVANKATAQNYATMDIYRFECGTKTPVDIAYSDSVDVSGTINNIDSNTFKVSAIDSRGLPKPITLIANNVVNYTNMVKGTASISRVGNVSEQSTLTFEGNIWVGNFGNATNSITSVTYQYKTADDATYTQGTTAIVPTVDANGHFTFSGLIKGDTNDGFDESNVYTIQVTVYDQLSSATYTLTLPSGKPHLAWYKDGLSIMGEYDETRTDALQVNGNLNISGNYLINGENILQANALSAVLYGNYTLASTHSYEKLPLIELHKVGTKISLNNNNIIIGQGVNYIRVSASVGYRTSTTTENKYVTIYQNSTVVARRNANIPANTSGELILTPFILPVSENDNITLNIYGTAGETLNGSSSTNPVALTYITVEAIG